MKSRFDLFNALLLIALSIAVFWIAIVLGRSTFGWTIPAFRM